MAKAEGSCDWNWFLRRYVQRGGKENQNGRGHRRSHYQIHSENYIIKVHFLDWNEPRSFALSIRRSFDTSLLWMGLAFHYLPNATKINQNGLPQDKRWSISPLANLGAYNLILHGCHATSYSSKIWQSGSTQYVNEIFNVSDLRLQIHFLWLEWTSFILSIRRSVDSRHSTDVFGNRLFIKCDQEQPKQTTTVIWSCPRRPWQFMT